MQQDFKLATHVLGLFFREDMLQNLKRMEDVDGLPKVLMSSPQQFFSSLTSEKDRLCKWVGELYLELHRGTYTTQAKLKLENRRGEFLFHDVDFMCAIDYVLNRGVESAKSTRDRLRPLWKKFLLNQFHDVLPGSCIEQVVKDSLAYYKEIKDGANSVLRSKLDAVINKVWKNRDHDQMGETCLVVNSFGWEKREIVSLPQQLAQEPEAKKAKLNGAQILQVQTQIALVDCVPFGFQALEICQPQAPVTLAEGPDGDIIILENVHLRATLKTGVLTSLVLKHSGTERESIAPKSSGSKFVMFDDVPLFWDAWDVMEYHLETREPLSVPGGGVSVLERGPLRASVQVKVPISSHSHILQQIILDADCPYLRFETTVEWHENRKFLKIEFPLNVRSHEATYEIQFGHLQRPTHFNTSWDQARFEVCAQKWADLSEHGFGVAVLNDCKYGHSTLGNIMRLSLLRAPKAPDATADMGTHHFTYAIMPHHGAFQEAGVIHESYNLNHPLSVTSSTLFGDPVSFFTTDNPAIILETVKTVELVSSTKAIVVRLYEAFGSQTSTTLTSTLPFKASQRCNLLEDGTGALEAWSGELSIDFEPFKIVNILLYF
ncbi:Alpha-mannosidase 2C1 [Geodia barretti]|uniref:Alpha-mannosidase 2C1 n=1 Tax=Geodia barretti TaxID=519541 RepID=A0AA35SSM3_GEOBA|nr:Alpha-mannosidase 2C1 [Geodia barretti]